MNSVKNEFPILDLFTVHGNDPYLEVYLLGPDAKLNENSMILISRN